MRARIGNAPARGEDVRDAGTTHRWGGLAALSLCGAVAGASVAEVVASIFTHPAAAVVLQPAADPLALAGAVLGLGAVLLNRRRLCALLEPPPSTQEETEDPDEWATSLPLHPQSWVPVPMGPIAPRPAFVPQAEQPENTEPGALEPRPIDTWATARPRRRPGDSTPLRLIPSTTLTSTPQIPAHAQCRPPHPMRRASHPGMARQRQAAGQ